MQVMAGFLACLPLGKVYVWRTRIFVIMEEDLAFIGL